MSSVSPCKRYALLFGDVDRSSWGMDVPLEVHDQKSKTRLVAQRLCNSILQQMLQLLDSIMSQVALS